MWNFLSSPLGGKTYALAMKALCCSRDRAKTTKLAICRHLATVRDCSALCVLNKRRVDCDNSQPGPKVRAVKRFERENVRCKKSVPRDEHWSQYSYYCNVTNSFNYVFVRQFPRYRQGLIASRFRLASTAINKSSFEFALYAHRRKRKQFKPQQTTA